METNSPCRIRKPSYHASNPLRNSADNKSSFMPRSNTTFDLSLYRDIVEIYREPMAPTCVYTAIRPGTNEKVAIKKIFKDELVNDFMRTQAAEEFPLHCTLDHPNIVRGLEYAENSREHILVMEYMNDAEYLKNKIETSLNPIKNEQKMRSFARDIFEAIAYLHSRNIVHGDIKFDNLLFHKFESEKMRMVKVCDFGLSRYLDEKTGKFLMTIPVGSVTYMAPEIKANSMVDEKIDLWAMGIVLYKMAVAYKPTQVNGYKYGSGPIPFRRVDWRKLSKELQDLISKLLEYEPEKRISAKDSLNHPWFQIEDQPAEDVSLNTVA